MSETAPHRDAEHAAPGRRRWQLAGLVALLAATLAASSVAGAGTYAGWSDHAALPGHHVGADTWEPDAIAFRIVVCQTINVREQGRIRVLVPQEPGFDPMRLAVDSLRFGAKDRETAPVVDDKGLSGLCEPGPSRGRALYFDMPIPGLTVQDEIGCIAGTMADGTPAQGCTTLRYANNPPRTAATHPAVATDPPPDREAVPDPPVTDADTPAAETPATDTPDTSSPDTSSPDTSSPDTSSPDASSPDASSHDGADSTATVEEDR